MPSLQVLIFSSFQVLIFSTFQVLSSGHLRCWFSGNVGTDRYCYIDFLINSVYVSRRACQGRRRRERTLMNLWRGFFSSSLGSLLLVENLPSRVVSWPPASRRGLWLAGVSISVYICLYLGCLSKANLCYFRSRTCVILRPEPVLFYVPYLCYFRSRFLVSREFPKQCT